MHERLIAVLFGALTLLSSHAAGSHPVSEGVSSITTGGNPASMVVFGDATPLIVREDGRVFAGATEVGEGRVVTLGHTGYFANTDPGTERLLKQAIAWLHEGEDKARVFGLSQQRLDALGADARSVSGNIRAIDLANVDILVCSPQEWYGAERLEDVRTFLENGGGAIIGECAWGQLQLERASDLDDLAVNRLLAGAGIAYTDRVESSTSTHVPGRVATANLNTAIETVLSDTGDRSFASRVACEAIRSVPFHVIEASGLNELLTTREARISTLAHYKEMPDTPLTHEEAPLACVMLAYEARHARDDGTWDYAHPTFRAFPGQYTVQDMPGLQTVTIDPSIPGWHSTGLWVLPGTRARVRSSDAPRSQGVTLQVGCWLDPQDFDGKVRFPLSVTTQRFGQAGSADIQTFIGGPLYIVMPEEAPRGEPIEFTIVNALPMPYFRLGETTLEEWNQMREKPTAPWVELASDELVFTLPMDMVQSCERPDLVMEHWDRVHAAMDELNPRSPNHWPDRQYRYVAEKKLSWGYMYCPSNAPIVIPMSAADEMVDLTQYDNEGSHQLWGHYHEMGHAHQSDAWTFNGTTEVTVNIFTVYALHTVNGYPLDSEHLRTSPETAWQNFEKHKADGAPFDTWKRDPFLALQTYAMLWHEFGFDAYKETFARYRDGRVAKPANDQAKRDTFVRTFSDVVQRDLSAYFEAWGVPISSSVGESLSSLDPWMPSEPE